MLGQASILYHQLGGRLKIFLLCYLYIQIYVCKLTSQTMHLTKFFRPWILFLSLGWVLFLSVTSSSIFMHQGDDGALQKAIALVLHNREDFVAILFYASWCPFSKIFRTDFRKLSSFFPTIVHFSFEESHIKPRCIFRKGINFYSQM